MKKHLSLLLAILMLFSLTACGGSTTSSAPASGAASDAAAPAPSAAAGETYNLRFAYTLATDHDLSIAFESFAKLVDERTNGAVTITTYPAGQLGTQPENLESVKLGSLDMCYADTSMLVTYVPQYSLINLPWLITSFDVADELFYGSDIIDNINAELHSKMNMTSLGWLYQGFRAFCTTKPLTSMADCKGVKLRSPEVDLYLDTFNIMGFNPTVITWTEAYTAMQSGVVDGVDTIKSSIYSYGFYEIGKYIWNSNHMFSSVGIVVNNDVFEGLPSEYQEAVQTAWNETIEWFNNDVKKLDADYKELYESVGATVTYTADEGEFRDAFHDYWYKSAETNGFKDGLDALMKIVEKHAA